MRVTTKDKDFIKWLVELANQEFNGHVNEVIDMIQREDDTIFIKREVLFTQEILEVREEKDRTMGEFYYLDNVIPERRDKYYPEENEH